MCGRVLPKTEGVLPTGAQSGRWRRAAPSSGIVLSQSPPSRLMITINRAWTTAGTTIAYRRNNTVHPFNAGMWNKKSRQMPLAVHAAAANNHRPWVGPGSPCKRDLAGNDPVRIRRGRPVHFLTDSIRLHRQCHMGHCFSRRTSTVTWRYRSHRSSLACFSIGTRQGAEARARTPRIPNAGYNR